jgi:hypothetical protein
MGRAPGGCGEAEGFRAHVGRSAGCPILYESHGTGHLVFGEDNALLAACGDGARYSTTDPGNIGHTHYAEAIALGIMRPEENVGWDTWEDLLEARDAGARTDSRPLGQREVTTDALAIEHHLMWALVLLLVHIARPEPEVQE